MNYARPGYRQMLEDLQLGRINCVIVKDISRLGRHFVMTSELVEQVFPQMGVRLICINDNYNSEDESADPTALTLPLEMVMNDYYVKDISKKIRSSITAKMDTGEYLPSSSSVPYGYLRNPEAVTFDIDPEPAAAVQEIYTMRAQGETYNGIARALNAKAIPCPGHLRFIRGVSKCPDYKDALWQFSTVKKILCDPVYTGIRIHGKVKRDRLGLPKTRRSQEEWQYIENAHQPIISKDLFQLVQKVNQAESERRSRFAQREKVGIDYRPLLKNKVYCADCGSLMGAAKHLRRPGNPATVLFECREYLSSQRTRCASHYIRQETLMDEVTVLLDQQVRIAVDVERLCAQVRQMPKVQQHQQGVWRELSSVTAKLKAVESKRERLLIDLAQRVIDREEYDFMRNKYEQQRDELLTQEAKAAGRSAAMESALSATEQWIRAVKRYQTLPEIDREVINTLIEKVLVYEDRHIKIVLRYTDPYLPLSDFLDGVEENAG